MGARKVTDAHCHPDWQGYNFKKITENMDECGIDNAWILTWECPADEFDPSYLATIPDMSEGGPISLARCAAYAERAPERFALGYAPDPRKPYAVECLDRAIRLYGVKIYGELKLRMMYDDPDALRMFRFCGKKGLPVLVHIDYEFDHNKGFCRPNWWYGGGMEAFERAVAACPETNFIGHAPAFWAHISGDGRADKEPYPSGPVVPGGKLPEMLAKYPNLYCDTSAGSGLGALKRDVEFTKKFITEFQDRIMHGRDDFHMKHMEFIDSLGLPESISEKIFYRNAKKLIN